MQGEHFHFNPKTLAERWAAINRLEEASCGYFRFLRLFDDLIADIDRYPNALMEEVLLFLSYGDIFSQAPPQTKRRFIDLVLNYQLRLTNICALDVHKRSQTLSNETKFLLEEARAVGFDGSHVKWSSFFVYQLTVNELLGGLVSEEQQVLLDAIHENTTKFERYRYYSDIHICDSNKPKPNQLIFQTVWEQEVKLIASYDMAKVRSLTISNYMGGSKNFGGSPFISSMNLQNLQVLQLDHLHLGNRVCKIIKSMAIPLIQTLALPGNLIDDRGCKWLTKRAWRHLRRLQLGHNKLSGQGLNYLAKIHAPLLERIVVVFNNFSFEGMVRTQILRYEQGLEQIQYFDYQFNESWMITGDLESIGL